ncbi:MAG: hypothetical protein ACE5JD_01775 [Candidatus Methylomirabilia bacterium]
MATRGLPPVTVIEPRREALLRGEVTEEHVRWFIVNPIYAGIGPATGRGYVSHRQWVKSAAVMVEAEGPEQFLVNFLHALRQTFGATAPRGPVATDLATLPRDAVFDPTVTGIGTTPRQVEDGPWVLAGAALMRAKGAGWVLQRMLRRLQEVLPQDAGELGKVD